MTDEIDIEAIRKDADEIQADEWTNQSTIDFLLVTLISVCDAYEAMKAEHDQLEMDAERMRKLAWVAKHETDQVRSKLAEVIEPGSLVLRRVNEGELVDQVAVITWKHVLKTTQEEREKGVYVDVTKGIEQ
jgi:hypothetical protein